jgi:hypothetical protein
VGFHSRASFIPSFICAVLILAATMSRFFGLSSFPAAAANVLMRSTARAGRPTHSCSMSINYSGSGHKKLGICGCLSGRLSWPSCVLEGGYGAISIRSKGMCGLCSPLRWLAQCEVDPVDRKIWAGIAKGWLALAGEVVGPPGIPVAQVHEG